MTLTSRLGALLAAGLLFVASFALTTPPFACASELTDYYRRALQTDPDDESLRYYYGICLLNDGDNQNAVAELLKVYPAFAESLEANYNLGLAFSRLGDPDNAQLYLDQAEVLGALDQPDLYPLAGLYFNIALLYNDKDLLTDASRLLDKVLTIDPRRQDALRLQADVLARNDQFDKAQALLHRYLLLYPQDTQMRDYLFALYYNRALAAMEAGRNDEARAGFNAALKLDPASIYAGYYLGYLDYTAGHFDTAATALIKIAPLAPPQLAESIPALLYNSALALLDRKQPESAEQIATYLLSLPAPTVRDLFLAGNVKLARKDFPNAIARYKEILSREPGHRGAATNLMAAENGQAAERMRKGQELFRKEDYRAALVLFEQILAFNGSYPLARQYAEESRKSIKEKSTALFAMAEDRMQQGALTEALQLVNRGLELTPDNERGKSMQQTLQQRITNEIESRFTVAAVLLQRRAFDEAATAYQALKELAPDDPRIATGIAQAATQRNEFIAAALAAGGQALAQRDPASAEQAYGRVLAIAADHRPALDGIVRVRELRRQLIEEELAAGRNFFAAGEADLGRKAFTRALALHDDPAIRDELKTLETAREHRIKEFLSAARTMLAKGEFKKCRGQLAQAAAIAPTDPQLAKAQQEYERKLRETITQTLTTAANKLQSGNVRGALKDFRTVLELEPNNAIALRGIEQGKGQTQKDIVKLVANGTSALEKGEFDKAESLFVKALDLDPYHAPARAGRDRIKQLKQTKAAPGDENALYLQGIDLYTKGAYEEAIGLWEKVLVIAPRHEKAQMNIEKAKRKLRQIKEYRNG